MMFRDQVGIVAGWFRGWSECEQTVALLALLKRVTRTQARFLQLCLEHSLADCPDIHLLEAEANSAEGCQGGSCSCASSTRCPDIHLLEAEANSAVAISWWPSVSRLPSRSGPRSPPRRPWRCCWPTCRCCSPATRAAKAEYMKRLQKVLADAIESNRCVEESRQLLSYALIHPATTADDRSALALWLGHLEERLAPPAPRRAHREWPPEPPEAGAAGWAEQQQQQQQQQQHAGTAGTAGPRGERAPSVSGAAWASSGSEHTEEPGGRNSFQEDGSGMKDVPSWLKSLRLHKYAALFAQMSYEEMMTLTERHLETQPRVTPPVCPVPPERHQGARHKIALSIQKLRERQSVLRALEKVLETGGTGGLRALEKDILEGGNLWSALQELQQILGTPIKAFRPPPPPAPPDGAPPEPPPAPPRGRAPRGAGARRGHPGAVHACHGQGSWCRAPDEENITSYLQLLEKCLSHEAFTETQKKRLQSWKQQVLKLLRAFPKKGPLDGPPGYRPPKSWLCGGGAAAGGGAAPSRCPPGPCPPPPARLGLLGPPGGGPPEPPWERPTPGRARTGRAFGSGPGGAQGGTPGSRGAVQRTHSLPVHSSALLAFPRCPPPGTDLEINPTLESLCLSMTEHALAVRGGQWGQWGH
ncbi:protein Smaug homolog 2-like [Passer domesticus]|uniref:protein Smaug homolog 2-like n=1 Tax=Passer domesticus TaxID=48849 RepID=UPI0030FEFCB1